MSAEAEAAATEDTAWMAETRPAKISVSDGRDKASATTFWVPERCLKSVVNSEIKDKCLVCLGERSVEDVMAPQSGLWSVKTGKCRPSR